MSALLVVLEVALAAASSGGVGERPEVEVARVDDAAITGAEVLLHLRPAPPRIGAALPPDPRRLALEEAIRAALFAREEAARLGLRRRAGTPLEQARLVQGFVRRALAGLALSPGDISDEEAHRFYTHHLDEYRLADWVALSTIVVEGLARAEALLAEAEGADDERFASLAERHSVDQATRSQRGSLGVVRFHAPEGKSLDPEVHHVAELLRRPGAVGLALASDGRYHVLRVSALELVVRPWNARTSLEVKNRIVRERRREHLDAVDERLRATARITVNEGALAALRIPTTAEYVAGLLEEGKGAR
jgi:hypothetical protein